MLIEQEKELFFFFWSSVRSQFISQGGWA